MAYFIFILSNIKTYFLQFKVVYCSLLVLQLVRAKYYLINHPNIFVCCSVTLQLLKKYLFLCVCF